MKQDAPKVEPPKIEGDNQMNLSNCCFEIQFPVKTATLFLSSTTPVNKEKWIHALTYSKYYHQNRLKLRHLFMNGKFENSRTKIQNHHER